VYGCLGQLVHGNIIFFHIMHGVVQVNLANEGICANRDVGNVLWVGRNRSKRSRGRRAQAEPRSQYNLDGENALRTGDNLT